MHRQDLGQRRADRHARVEASVGILKHHLAEPRQALLAKYIEEVAAEVSNLAGGERRQTE